MGLFEKIFKKEAAERAVRGYFKTLTAYTPCFTSFEGGLYEMELTRAAIHTFATHCSKFKPEIKGAVSRNLERALQFKPNPYMDTSKFLYRLATIYSVNNNAFIVPMYERDMQSICGYYPVLPERCEIVDVDGEPWIRYTFGTGQKGSVELSRAGLLTQFQYKDDFFGEDNRALYPTMQLIHTQNEGIREGVKSGAAIRFMAKLASTLKSKDIAEERDRFVQDNLTNEAGGVMMFDAKYADVKQITSQPFIVNPSQMKLIQENVYQYFGTNQKILQNAFDENDWNAYYEGKLEPFALQLSLVMSNMTFSDRQAAFGSQILFTANRLQYASNQTKLNIVTQLFDRGFLTHNEGLEIFNMAGIGPEGDKHFIRKEYAEVSKLDGGMENADMQGQGIQSGGADDSAQGAEQ